MIDTTRTSRPNRPDADSPRIVLAHDWLVGVRGGEWVLDRLARRYGPTTLYTLVSDGQPLTRAIDDCHVRTSPLQRLPGAAGRLRRWYLPLYAWAVERLRVQPCDLLISTSSAVMKSIIPPALPNGRGAAPHLCYCHSPARYIWEQSDDYRVGSAGALRQAGLRLIRRRFQQWDRRTASRVTRFLANSRHTAARIERCYGREAFVVYPPVRTSYFTPDESVAREDWLLVVSALEPYKRVDLVIDAARRTRRRLKVIGSGSQFDALRAVAPDNVELLGRVSDDVMLDHYRRAAAFVFPQLEDFGITAVEAQAAGCPVIALNAGGARETVTPDTGEFFEEQSTESLAEAIERFDASRYSAAACRANAERFSEAAFDEAVHQHVEELLK